jgi:hypothetical protein
MKRERIDMQVLLVLLLSAMLPKLLGAQEFPRVAVEFAAGKGSHSARSGETWFRDSVGGIVRVGGLIRLLSFGRVAAVARLDYNMPSMADAITDCRPAPNGSCRRYFPTTDGGSVGVGAIVATLPHLRLGGSAGFFRSRANPYTAVNASLQLAKHFDAVTELRYFTLPFESGPRVWFRPLELGFRVY